MVNKAVVGILAGIVLISLTVGIFIGMAIGGGGGGTTAADGGSTNDGGGGGGGGNTPTAAQATPIPTNNSTASGSNVTTTIATTTAPATSTTAPTPTATPTPVTTTQPPRTTILPRRFDTREIASELVARINDKRENRGLETLSNSGTVVTNLQQMAKNHSVQMADEAAVIHTINGRSSSARYKQYNLYDTCKWNAADGDYLVTSDNNALEAIGRTYAGREYQDDGQTKFNGNETQIANALYDTWMNQDTYKQRLLLGNARRIAVGIEITQSGEVYATADIC
jgi:hypothetical protein